MLNRIRVFLLLFLSFPAFANISHLDTPVVLLVLFAILLSLWLTGWIIMKIIILLFKSKPSKKDKNLKT